MELGFLLEEAINNIQNLKEYYESQIEIVMTKVERELEKYKYGVALEKYFFSKSTKMEEVGIEADERILIDEIMAECNVEENEEGIVVQYKLKNHENLMDEYELDPQKAHKAYVRLIEQPQILSESTLMMLLIKFEETISRLFKYVMLKYPEAYLKDKSITYSEILAIQSEIKVIKSFFVEKEVEEIMRQPLGDWFHILEQKHKASFMFDNKEFDMFKEIYYRRNLVVHNQGKVNDVYIKNVKEEFRKDIRKGEVLTVDKKYLLESFEITQTILYGLFWGIRKLSKDKAQLEQIMFNIGFLHMLNGQWNLSEFIYNLLKQDEDQAEASKLCNKINYWISIKNLNRMDEIICDIEKFDVSAMQGQFKAAKYALLNKHEEVSNILDEILGSGLQTFEVERWPLFIQYRESNEYHEFREKHKEKFEVFGYQPEFMEVASDDEALDEFIDELEKI